MQILLTTLHVVASLMLIGVVLLQSGRGGGVGAAFAGASSQVFGGRGASTFLTRVTTGAAAMFFLTSLGLSTLSSRHRSVLLRTPAPPAAAPEAAPAADGGAAGELAPEEALPPPAEATTDPSADTQAAQPAAAP